MPHIHDEKPSANTIKSGLRFEFCQEKYFISFKKYFLNKSQGFV